MRQGCVRTSQGYTDTCSCPVGMRQDCVRTSQGYTDTCSCPVGLRQGCCLSPILFAMFIDELYTVLFEFAVRAIQLLPNLTEICLLMFEDDIALIADTVVSLRRQFV